MSFKPLKFLVRLAGGYFNLIAGSASIISLFIIFTKDKNQLIIALACFVLFLFFCFFRLIWFTEQYLQSKSENGYYKLSTAISYSTTDGKIITHEIQKYIQCKQLIMVEHDHEFYWTGTKEPMIESETMKFECIKEGENNYKKAILKFITPLVYNKFFLIQIRMKLDDTNGVSKPFIGLRVKENTQLIQFKVQLLHKKPNGRKLIPDAKFQRKKLGLEVSQDFEHLENIPFNPKTHSYEYNKYNPEIGYTYRIEWEK